MMNITEHFAMMSPMKWTALEQSIEDSELFIHLALRWVKMSEIERLLDTETPEELEWLFSESENHEIVEAVVEVMSALN